MADITTTQGIIIYFIGVIIILIVCRWIGPGNSGHYSEQEIATIMTCTLFWIFLLPFAVACIVIWLIFKFVEWFLKH